jgi:hypothetical protein
MTRGASKEKEYRQWVQKILHISKLLHDVYANLVTLENYGPGYFYVRYNIEYTTYTLFERVIVPYLTDMGVRTEVKYLEADSSFAGNVAVVLNSPKNILPYNMYLTQNPIVGRPLDVFIPYLEVAIQFSKQREVENGNS